MGVDRSVGAVQATIGDGSARAVITAGNDSMTVTASATLLGRALDEVRSRGGGAVHWWVQGAGPEDDAVAAAHGLALGRRLLQMQRALPMGQRVEIETRAFRPGADEEAWLHVNNRSFAGHPEQGGWTLPTLLREEAEPWFDPDGFRLHERDGRLAGSCWTKLHPATEDAPVVGEIYVIGVDPDFHGLGLGKQLTLAGLESIAERDVTDALLYVDAANTPAVRMYEKLGFKVTRADKAYTAVLTSAGLTSEASERRTSGRESSQD